MRALAIVILAGNVAFAATSPLAVTSPMGGNGHNVSFDGRLFVVRTGAGWDARVFRRETVTVNAGVPDIGDSFSAPVLVQNDANNENALALCEATPQPTRCNSDGSPNGGGSHACYDVYVIDSDAVAAAPNNVMRRRRLKVVVSSPNTANAGIASFTWTEPTLTPLQTTLRGIEPSVTRDGKLLVWQGVPANNGSIDTVVYSTNQTACAVTGWTAPRSIAGMNTDTNVVGRYRLAERPLRDPNGVAYAPTQVVYGGLPVDLP